MSGQWTVFESRDGGKTATEVGVYTNAIAAGDAAASARSDSSQILYKVGKIGGGNPFPKTK